MITAVLDTNVILQAMIGSSRSASSRTILACFDGRYRAVFSNETLDELYQALGLPVIRARHGLSDEQILQFVSSLLLRAALCSHVPKIGSQVRDVSDKKFLALAAYTDATYLVTNDRRHLLRLKTFGNTGIVTPARFLRELDKPSRNELET